MVGWSIFLTKHTHTHWQIGGEGGSLGVVIGCWQENGNNNLPLKGSSVCVRLISSPLKELKKQERPLYIGNNKIVSFIRSLPAFSFAPPRTTPINSTHVFVNLCTQK